MSSMKNLNKLEVLKDILLAKKVLFGALSDKCTKQDKIKAWKVIQTKACALGLVQVNKDYTYVRDVFWQNLKKTTQKKVDNRRRTGTGGGKEYKLNDIDKAVLDIIRKDSAGVRGLNVQETWDDGTNNATLECERENMMEVLEPEQQSLFICSNTTEENQPYLRNLTCNFDSRETKKKKRIEVTEEESLVTKKLRLQCELLTRDIYLKDMEILSKEKELKLPASDYTKKIFSSSEFLTKENRNKSFICAYSSSDESD